MDDLEELGTALIEAILYCKPIEYIRELVSKDAPLWYQAQDSGWSALHAAAFAENFEVVQLLIEKGAVWNAGNCSPLRRSSLTYGQWTISETLRAMSRYR